MRETKQGGQEGVTLSGVETQSDKYTKGLPEGLPGRGGECLAALRTGIVKNCLHAAYLEYNWNGRAIDAVFEVNQVL